MREQLHVLVENASLSKETALKKKNLPTAKVDRVENFGGLRYANEGLFSFVERLEYVFRHTLTPELLVMNGSYLIELVYVTMNEEDNVLGIIAQLCEDSVEAEVLAAVMKYITQVYFRMRGKDFARNLMSTDTHSLKQTRRPTLAAASNPIMYKAKRIESKDKDADVNEIEYILFDAAAGNTLTEGKCSVDDSNLLES